MARYETLANAVIGGIGAVGQGVLLAHTLECYPFKILSSPPSEFYSSTGWLLAFIAPLGSMAAFRIFRSMWPPFLTAVPLVACPLLFWALYRVAFFLSGYRYVERGSDVVATRAVESGLVQQILWFTVAGLVIGIASGFVVKVVCNRLQAQTH